MSLRIQPRQIETVAPPSEPVEVLLGCFVAGLAATLAVFGCWMPLGFLGAGLACSAAAKASLARRGGGWLSGCAAEMRPVFAKLYHLGYVLMGVGTLFSAPTIAGLLGGS